MHTVGLSYKLLFSNVPFLLLQDTNGWGTTWDSLPSLDGPSTRSDMVPQYRICLRCQASRGRSSSGYITLGSSGWQSDRWETFCGGRTGMLMDTQTYWPTTSPLTFTRSSTLAVLIPKSASILTSGRYQVQTMFYIFRPSDRQCWRRSLEHLFGVPSNSNPMEPITCPWLLLLMYFLIHLSQIVPSF